MGRAIKSHANSSENYLLSIRTDFLWFGLMKVRWLGLMKVRWLGLTKDRWIGLTK